MGELRVGAAMNNETDQHALEKIILDYVERFGLTDMARNYFVRARAASIDNVGRRGTVVLFRGRRCLEEPGGGRSIFELD